jgi:small subunit ribosomal protein S1
VNVLILEIDGERRRLSLSLKRVEEGMEPLPRADGGESVHSMPNLKLSEEAFPAGADDEPVLEADGSAALSDDVELADEPAAVAVAQLETDELEEPAEAETAADEEPEAAAAE